MSKIYLKFIIEMLEMSNENLKCKEKKTKNK